MTHDEHEHHHHHDGECDDPECSCHHHHHHADEVFTSWGAETPTPTREEDIRRILTALDTGDYGASSGPRASCRQTAAWIALRLCARGAGRPHGQRRLHRPPVRHRRPAEGGQAQRAVQPVTPVRSEELWIFLSISSPAFWIPAKPASSTASSGTALPEEDRTLLICCEEGELEYDPRALGNVFTVHGGRAGAQADSGAVQEAGEAVPTQAGHHRVQRHVA